MNKQRRFVLLASITGVVSIFLPWVDTTFENFSGLRGVGIPILLCFVLSGIIAVTGNRSMHLNKNRWMVTLVTGCIAVLLTGILLFSKMNSIVNIFGYGLSMALIAACGVILAAYIFRQPDQNYKQD